MRHSKYFKPYSKVCSCGKRVIVLKTINNKFIWIDPISLTPQEQEDLRAGINFFYNTSHHICHWITCLNAKKKEQDIFRYPPNDNRYGDND